jgi:hypothetical protein
MMERWRKGSAKAELANSGAWWRLAYRADSDLMERVLAEINVLVKEGQIKDDPGKAAADLWKRWGGKLPQKFPKPLERLGAAENEEAGNPVPG